jgi:hypothetical protein
VNGIISWPAFESRDDFQDYLDTDLEPSLNIFNHPFADIFV